MSNTTEQLNIWAVSYTHLDVYKRQTQNMIHFSKHSTSKIHKIQIYTPQSHTIIDVYKRQPPSGCITNRLMEATIQSFCPTIYGFTVHIGLSLKIAQSKHKQVRAQGHQRTHIQLQATERKCCEP